MERTVEGTHDGARATPNPGAAGEPLFAPGATIAARYQLVRLIARGGMGEVYEADDLELGTRVAIKTIRPDRATDPRAIARLKQELLAARKVTHPNVVRLFDVGFHVLSDEREVAFFTMELLAGETLDARVERLGPLPVNVALPIARQLCSALDAAHAAGIVHRDFKSQNVVMVGDRAYVTDFGLALDGEGAADVAGTPAYMAPEQRTRGAQIGPAADIYALGVVLFELVTGQVPFDLAVASTRDDVPGRTAATRRSARELARDLPLAWDAAIARCLRDEPGERFGRAGDVAAALAPRKRWSRVAAAAILALGAGGAALALRGGTGSRCEAPALPDLYVDGSAAPGGTGSRTCPFTTVADALAVAGEKRVIHVAPGFYDRAHGERFPLVIRGDTTLAGSGADRTTLSGTGSYDTTASGGTLGFQKWQATIVAGDDRATVAISGLALEPGVKQVASDSVGIACTRGGSGVPTTKLSGLVIGPSYGDGVIVATETVPRETACNLEISDSRLFGGHAGIWQVGCGAGVGRVPTSVRVKRTTFEGFRDQPTTPAAGISAYDCVAALEVDDSSFGDSDIGINIISHEGEQRARASILHSKFRTLTRAGVQLLYAPDAVLRGNWFISIRGAGEMTGKAAAIRLHVDPSGPSHLILRDNQIFENDIGVELAGTGPMVAATALDFGRAGDSGGNEIACNAAPDLAIRVDAEPGARVDAVGNEWDHVPPTRGSGADILEPKSGPALDTAGARQSETICNLGR